MALLRTLSWAAGEMELLGSWHWQKEHQRQPFLRDAVERACGRKLAHPGLREVIPWMGKMPFSRLEDTARSARCRTWSQEAGGWSFNWVRIAWNAGPSCSNMMAK
eukprot:3917070-Rhodomonas_salina.2